MRELTRDEQRISAAVAAKLLELQEGGHRPTHVAVYRTLFLNVGELHGLKLIRAGYLPSDQAALMVIADSHEPLRPSK